MMMDDSAALDMDVAAASPEPPQQDAVPMQEDEPLHDADEHVVEDEEEEADEEKEAKVWYPRCLWHAVFQPLVPILQVAEAKKPKKRKSSSRRRRATVRRLLPPTRNVLTCTISCPAENHRRGQESRVSG